MKWRFECRAAVASLLTSHGMEPPKNTIELLEELVVRVRFSERAEKGEPRSPSKALHRAKRYVQSLLKYLESPPTRPDSVPKLCTKLRRAIGGLAGVEILIFKMSEGGEFRYKELDESLMSCQPDADSLQELLDTLQRMPKGNWESVGRPHGLHWEVIRTGCIAWRRAGRNPSYSWAEDEGVLKGEMPGFLRDLIALCKIPKLSHTALHGALYRLQKDATYLT